MNARLENIEANELRYDWTDREIAALFDLPFMDLIYQAQQIHRQHFDPNKVQISSLLSIKTGKCRKTVPIVRKVCDMMRNWKSIP